MIQNSPKFKAGDFLVEELGAGNKYYLIVEEVTKTKYRVCHTYFLDNEKYLSYSKNSGHDGFVSFENIEKTFKKVGYIPALIAEKNLTIKKS